MFDENELIDDKYWVHWQLTPGEWNSFAKIRIEQEKEDTLSYFSLAFVFSIL